MAEQVPRVAPVKIMFMSNVSTKLFAFLVVELTQIR